MKRIIYYIAIAAVMLAATSCVEPLDQAPASSQGLTLSFSCGTMTKATVAGVGNENLIKRIDYFIFPLNGSGSVDNNTKSIFHDYIVPTDGGLNITYKKTLNSNQIATIFANATEVMLFAVANYVDKVGAAVESPNTTIPTDSEDKITWQALHELEVGETFFYNDGKLKDDGSYKFGLRWPRKMNPDDSRLFFVMTGEKKVTSQQLSTEIPLARLASKVTVEFAYQNYTDTKGVYWIPQSEAEETRVFLSNAIEHTTLGGPLTRPLVGDSSSGCTQPQGNGKRDIFEYAYDFLNSDVTPTTVNGVARKIAHYYTYPISMEEGDDNQPYLKLVLPWYGYKYYGSATGEDIPPYSPTNPDWMLYKQKEVYYKIVLPRSSVDKGNRIYEYSVNVNIIGAEKEVLIQGDYIVKNWLTRDEISSNVATGRYISLDIPKDEYDMYTDHIDIAFVSSGEVEISQLKIYQDDFSSATSTVIDFITGKNGNTYTYGSGKSANTEDIAHNKLPNWVTIEGSKLVVQHQMNNDFSDSDFDAAPMTFIVTLHLKGESDITFDRTVTITQYPSLYVTKNEHTGYVFVNGYGTTTGTRPAWDNRGNQGNNETSSRHQYFLGNVVDQDSEMTPSSSSNNNPNNYTIYVTLLDNNSSGWKIGDPRDAAGTLNYIDVTRYRKTKQTGADNIISPAFKIASSYGMVANRRDYDDHSEITYDNAVKRCASYQENGYPAGRWRVPTEAEMEFVIYLSDYGKVPSLFQGSYFASSGRYLSYENGDFRGFLDATSQWGYRVRCVYDVWYWGDEPYQENANTWLGFQD